MSDAHDEAAKALRAEQKAGPKHNERLRCPGCKAVTTNYGLTVCSCNGWDIEAGRKRDIEEHAEQAIAAALRKAAADGAKVARERAAQIAETHVGYHVNGVAHSIAAAIRSDGCDGCLACRARAKGGA